MPSNGNVTSPLCVWCVCVEGSKIQSGHIVSIHEEAPKKRSPQGGERKLHRVLSSDAAATAAATPATHSHLWQAPEQRGQAKDHRAPTPPLQAALNADPQQRPYYSDLARPSGRYKVQ